MIEIWPRKRGPSPPSNGIPSSGGSAPSPDDAQLPMELTFSIPRDVAWTPLGRLAIGFVVVYFLGACIFSAWVSVDSARRQNLKRQMASMGRTTTAQVVRTARSDRKEPTETADYAFTVNGETYRGRASIDLRRMAGVATGSEVRVVYLPSRPSVSWIVGCEPTGVPLFAIPLILVAVIAGAASILWNLRRERALLTEGRPALARVTNVRRVMTRRHSRRRVWLEYRLLDGAVQEGHADRSWQVPMVGSTVVVLYDPDRPERVAIYPLRLVRVRLPG